MPPAPSKLHKNDDGTITVPVRNAAGIYEPVVLREPTMEELATIHDAILDANEALPQIPPLTTSSTADELRAANDAAQERRRAVYSAEGPHGQTFLMIVAMLSETAASRASLPGWAMAPRACQELLDHFTDPLGGAPDGAQGWA